jgi:hypothetical protein
MTLLGRDNENVGGGGYTFDLMKVLRVISGNVEEATGDERAMDAGQEFRGECTTAMVPPFGPRIGEKKVKSRDASGWDQMFYRVGDLDSKYASVI